LTDPNSYRYPNFNRPLEIKESELISLWGYKVKPWIAGIYAFMHLFVYFCLYHYSYRPLWLTTIFKNSFLTLVYGIISLGLANTLLPILFSPIDLKGILKLIQDMYWKAITKKVKI
jgi:hypothetical protein